MRKPFVLLSCVFLVGLGSACESNTSTPERIPNEAARGSHAVLIEQFLTEAPTGQYLVSDSRNDEP
ncbi:MAG: hypothetical protein ACKOX5_04985, partial [Bacteroidota bacterium]